MSSRLGSPSVNLFVVNFGILEKLRQAFVDPKRQPIGVFAHAEMRIFVVNRRVRVFSFSVQAQQDIALVGSR